MKKIRFFFLLFIAGLYSVQTVYAQNCDGVRYFAPVFASYDSITPTGDTIFIPSYDSSTVIYSIDGMTMDIYQPHGDTATNRKTLLMIHGGNWYEGSSLDPFIYHICQLFVEKGYVTVSINYPLITPDQILQQVLLDSTTAYPIIAQTICEGKAAVRYLKANAAALNIDSNWIVIGGESSGALIADHVAYLKDSTGVSPLLDSAFDALGGIEGSSGNPNHASTVKAILNYGGAMLSLNMLSPLDFEPIYTAQGDSDHNIPFGCGELFDWYTDYTACGAGAMQPVLYSLGIPNTLLMFDSLDYEPWADSTMAQSGDTNHIALNQVVSQTNLFLYQLDCPNYTNIRTIYTIHASLYPNPASSSIFIQTDADMESIEMVDMLGRPVRIIPAKGNKSEIDISSLSGGLYLARIHMGQGMGTIARSFVVE